MPMVLLFLMFLWKWTAFLSLFSEKKKILIKSQAGRFNWKQIACQILHYYWTVFTPQAARNLAVCSKQIQCVSSCDSRSSIACLLLQTWGLKSGSTARSAASHPGVKSNLPDKLRLASCPNSSPACLIRREIKNQTGDGAIKSVSSPSEG